MIVDFSMHELQSKNGILVIAYIKTFGISLFRIDLSCVSLFEIKVHAWKFGQHHFFLTRKCQDYPSLWYFLFHCSTFSHTICDSKQMSTYKNVIFTKNSTLFTLSTVLHVHALYSLKVLWCFKVTCVFGWRQSRVLEPWLYSEVSWKIKNIA